LAIWLPLGRPHRAERIGPDKVAERYGSSGIPPGAPKLDRLILPTPASLWPGATEPVQAKEAVTSNSVGCRSQQGVDASVKPVSLANAMKAKRRAAIRRRLEHAWFLAVVLYALIRIFLADKFLAKYGLPIKPFALVEVVSSMVYALASARFVGALVDNHNRKAGFFGLCTLVGFGAPDVFVIVASDHIPRSIYVVLALIVLGTAVYTIRELRVKMRKARVQKQSVPGAEPAEPQ
jgi:hypothetical protein